MSRSRSRKSNHVGGQGPGRQTGTLRNEHRAQSGPDTMWHGKHVFWALCGGILLGGLVGFGIGRSTVDESATRAAVPQASSMGGQAIPVSPATVAPQMSLEDGQQTGAQPIQPPRNPAGSLLDAYGRPPSDPHYGHQHP